jgi:hypothetical protein
MMMAGSTDFLTPIGYQVRLAATPHPHHHALSDGCSDSAVGEE